MHTLPRRCTNAAMLLLLAGLAVSPASAQFTFAQRCGSNEWRSTCTFHLAPFDYCQNNWDQPPAVLPNCSPFPGPGDFVIIPPGANALLASGNQIGTLDVQAGAALNMTGGGLTFTGSTGSMSIDGAWTWNGGSLNGAGITTVNTPFDIALYDVSLNGRTLENNASAVWSGSNTVAVNDGALIENRGYWICQADNSMSYFYGPAPLFSNTGTLRKAASFGTSTFSLPVRNTGQVESLTGTLRFTGGGVSLSPFGNNGSGGDFTISANAAVAFGNSYTLGAGSTVYGAGVLQILGGATTIDAGAVVPVQNMYLLATLNGPGEVQHLNTFQWSGGAINGPGLSTVIPTADVYIDLYDISQNSRTLSNAGAVHWSATNTIGVNDGSIINNSGTWDAAGNGSISYFYGAAPQFSNTALFVKSGGSGNTTLSLPFLNRGLVHAQTGTIRFQGGGESSSEFGNGGAGGDFIVEAGAAITLANNFTLGAGCTVSGAGILQITGGTTTVPEGAVVPMGNVYVLSTVSGAGEAQHTQTLTWAGGALTGTGRTVILPGAGAVINQYDVSLNTREFVNQGTTTWSTSGTIAVNDSAVIRNIALWECTGNGSMSYFYGSPPSFNNTGEFRKSGGAGTTSLSVPFFNSGLVNAQSGTIRITGGGVSSSPGGDGGAGGDFNISADATVDMAGSFTLGAGCTVAGEGALRIVGGQTSVAAGAVVPISHMTLGATLGGLGECRLTGSSTWSGGVMSEAGTTAIQPGASLDINLYDVSLNDRTLDNNGLVNWTSTNTIGMNNGARINNAGAWECSGNGSLAYFYGSPPAFTNTGVLGRRAGFGTVSFSAPVFNYGRVEVETGTMRMSGGGRSSSPGGNGGLGGDFDIRSGASLDFANSFTFGAGASSTGAGLLRMLGGSMQFESGAVVPFSRAELSGGAIDGPGEVDMMSFFDWKGGTMTGLGRTVVTQQATGTISLYDVSIGSRTLVNRGTINWDATNTIGVNDGAVIENTGSFNMFGNGSMNYNFGAAPAFRNTGAFCKLGGGGTSSINTPFVNTGLIVAASGTLRLNGSMFEQPQGITSLAGGDIASGSPIAFAGGSVTGAGRVVAPAVLNAAASFEPGVGGGTGRLDIVGNYTQAGGGVLDVLLGGPDAGVTSDLLAVSDRATLSGTLRVAVNIQDLSCLRGEWTVLTAHEVVGEFANVEGPEGLVVRYTPTAVIVEYGPCAADYNLDGGVDGADVEAFFADWENGVCGADVNGDGGIDGADVEYFYARWEAGGCF